VISETKTTAYSLDGQDSTTWSKKQNRFFGNNMLRMSVPMVIGRQGGCCSNHYSKWLMQARNQISTTIMLAEISGLKNSQ